MSDLPYDLAIELAKDAASETLDKAISICCTTLATIFTQTSVDGHPTFTDEQSEEERQAKVEPWVRAILDFTPGGVPSQPFYKWDEIEDHPDIAQTKIYCQKIFTDEVMKLLIIELKEANNLGKTPDQVDAFLEWLGIIGKDGELNLRPLAQGFATWRFFHERA